MSTSADVLYQALLGAGAVSDAELRDVAELLGLSGQAERLLARLTDLGLVVGVPADPPRYLALAPGAAVEMLTARQQRDLADARLKVAELAARFSRASSGASASDMVELLVGPESIRRSFDELQRGTRTQVRGFDIPPYVADDWHNAVESEMLRRGVAYRVLYDRLALDTAEFLPRLTEMLAAGEQARLVEAPIKLVIFDDTHALMPAYDQVSADDVRAAIVVREPTLIGALTELFELSWACAVPLRVSDQRSARGPAEVPTEIERAILLLLAGGLSEPDIAAHLRMNERTVRRHLRDLFDKLGAKTRMQAGYQAVVRGWLNH